MYETWAHFSILVGSHSIVIHKDYGNLILDAFFRVQKMDHLSIFMKPFFYNLLWEKLKNPRKSRDIRSFYEMEKHSTSTSINIILIKMACKNVKGITLCDIEYQF